MKTRLTGATFDASAKTITHASFSDVTLAGIQLITNVTDQIIIYNFADTTKGGTLSTDTLTLEYDTTSMSDTDELMILVEDGSASTAINDGGNTITVDGTVTANLSATDNAVLDSIQSDLENTISTNNSTTTPLSGGGVFTGTADDVSLYSSVTINIKADVDSAASGMSFQFSPNGTNWDDVYNFTLDSTTSTNRCFQFPVTARYFRVVYTNGAGAQSAFRVQTILHRGDVLTSIHRVDDVIRTDRSATLVKSVIAAKVAEGAEFTTANDGEYENLSMSTWRELRTRDQRQADLANCNDYTAFTTLGNDTANLANTTDHVFGTGAITFDKVNGAANTVFAGVQDTITSIDLSERFEAGSFVGAGLKVTSLADIDYAFIRIGTDSSNYNEWQVPVEEMVASQWMALRVATNQPTTYAGNGWNPAAVTYIAFGLAFNAETNTLSGIKFDNVHIVGGRVTDSTIDATVTSAVNTPNINIHRVGGQPTDTSTGNASTGTQRVVLASNQPAVPVTQSGTWDEVGINDSGNSITVDYATTGSGTATGALRVELPTNGTGVIATVGAVTAITNALPAGTNAIGKLAANSGVDIGDVDITSVVPGTGATNLGKAEDAAHTTGDTGVMMLGVRSASPTDRSAGPTDGDYEPFALNEVGAIWVTETSSINGGDSTATASTADGSTALTNSAQVIKASAGKLTGYYIYNPNSSATYVNFYNTAAASVTVGTTNPLFNICIPATSAANLSGLKVTFGTAMSWSATTTGGGNTAPSTALEATCWYK